MSSYSAILLAVAAIWFGWLIYTERGDDRPSPLTIESSELWHNPWPAPGGRNGSVNGYRSDPAEVH